MLPRSTVTGTHFGRWSPHPCQQAQLPIPSLLALTPLRPRMRSTLGTNRDDDLVAVSEPAVAAPRRQGRRRGLRGGRGRGTAPEPDPVQPNAPRTARTVAETQGQSRVELRELERRAEVFRHGEWLTLLRDASRTPASRSLTAKPFSAGDETTSSLMSSATRTAGPKGESSRSPQRAGTCPGRGMPCTRNTAACLPARSTPRLGGGAIRHDE